MPISKKQIAHIAELAGLNLSSDEQEQFSRELSRIIDYMNVLKEIDTGSIEIRSGTAVQGVVCRDDIADRSLPLKEALKNAPEKRDTHFVVPRVI
jgi:aspartyl-tRNA(Asn)/glutamyl-tRNA(Gln) amidotransferase subunit C